MSLVPYAQPRFVQPVVPQAMVPSAGYYGDYYANQYGYPGYTPAVYARGYMGGNYMYPKQPMMGYGGYGGMMIEEDFYRCGHRGRYGGRYGRRGRHCPECEMYEEYSYY